MGKKVIISIFHFNSCIIINSRLCATNTTGPLGHDFQDPKYEIVYSPSIEFIAFKEAYLNFSQFATGGGWRADSLNIKNTV